MKIAIMQPYFMPYIGYFQLIKSVDKFILYDDIAYIVGGWVNRNRILVNNQSSMITVPLVKASQNKLINQIDISMHSPWRVKHLKSIELAYKKAPNFAPVFEIIKDVYKCDSTNAAEFICHSIKKVCNFLDFETEIVASSSVYNNAYLSGQARIIDICLQEGADQYINPAGGMELYSRSLFQEKNIQLQFIKSNSIVYRQFSQQFEPSLSIIDVLMFNSKAEIAQLLTECKIV